MEAAMVAMFPKGIRILIVDDDAKFLKSATILLSVLNYEAVICSSVARAVKSLTSGELKGFDAILIHAAKAAACGFNFHAIIEADLLIPVIYFLPLNHHATGNEADELLRTLQAGTYIIKKPLDTNEVHTLLWTVIAWRKYDLVASKSKRTAVNAFDFEAGLDAEGEDNHFKVVRSRRGQKRKCSSNLGGSSVGTAAAAGGHPSAKGKEKDNVASQQQPALQKHARGKKAQKNSDGEAFKLAQPNTAMMNGQQPGQHLYSSKFFSNTIVLPYSPDFFSDAASSSSNAGIFGDNMPLALAAAPTMAAAPAAYGPQFSQGIGNQQPQDVHPPQKFGPFPYQAPPLAPKPVGDALDTTAILESLLSDDFNDNSVGSPLVAPDQVLGLALNVDELIATVGAAPFVAPQDLGAMPKCGTTNVSLFMAPHQDLAGSVPNGGSSNAALFLALNVSDLTMKGGAFGNISSAPLMAPQDLGAAASNGGGSNAAPIVAPYQDLGAVPHGDQLLLVDNDIIDGSLMRSQSQSPNAVMDGDVAGLTAAMLPSDQYEDNTSVPLDALLGDLHGRPMFEFDDADMNALFGGGATTNNNAAGTSLIIAGEEEDGNVDVLDSLVGLEIPHDVFQLNGLMFP